MLKRWLSITGLAIIAFVYLMHYTITIPLNADYANNMLMAQSMLHGNLLLHNWVLDPDPFWLTEIPVYMLAIKVLGFTPLASHVASVAVYLVLCATAAIAVFHGPRKEDMRIRLAVVLLPMLALSPFLATLTLVGPQHVGTVAIILILVMLWPGTDAPLWTWRNGASMLLLTAAYLSDPFVLWVYLIPSVVLFALAILLKRKNDLRLLTTPVMVAVASYTLSMVVRIALIQHHDLLAYSVPISLTTDLGENLRLFAGGFPAMYGISTQGWWNAVLSVPHLLIFLPAMAFLVWTPLMWYRGRDVSLSSALLSLSALAIMAAFITSSMPQGLSFDRYLLPTFVFSLVVLAREVDLRPAKEALGRWVGSDGRRVAMGIITLLLLFPSAESVATPAVATPWPTIIAWLDGHHLKNGYGAYWDASIVTLYSKNSVSVRAITLWYAAAEKSGKLAPYLWMAQEGWYKPSADARFVIDDTANYGGVSPKTIEDTFGKPAFVHHIGKYSIFVWRHPIYTKPLTP